MIKKTTQDRGEEKEENQEEREEERGKEGWKEKGVVILKKKRKMVHLMELKQKDEKGRNGGQNGGKKEEEKEGKVE